MGSHRNPSARDAHTARTAHTARRVRRPVRARPPHEAPAMPRAKGEELRWLVVFKRVVEGTPIGSVAAECRVSQTFAKSMVAQLRADRSRGEPPGRARCPACEPGDDGRRVARVAAPRPGLTADHPHRAPPEADDRQRRGERARLDGVPRVPPAPTVEQEAVPLPGAARRGPLAHLRQRARRQRL